MNLVVGGGGAGVASYKKKRISYRFNPPEQTPNPNGLGGTNGRIVN